MRMRMLLALLALTSLTACDYIGGKDFQKERSERLYRDAMDDFRAGRLKQAVQTLKKVCQGNPQNASARFQLACLLQDSEKDYMGATCAFREYLLLQPDSDKTGMARDRLKACEGALASQLATSYGLNAAEGRAKEIAELRSECDSLKKRNAKLMKDLEASMRRVTSLVEELDRLKSLISTAPEGPDRSSDVVSGLETAQQDLAAESPTKETLATLAQEMARELDANEDRTAQPLIVQPTDAKARREAAQLAEREAKEAADREAAKQPKRPASYVVQDGDTLYKIALRFYGRVSAWSRIREVNKATVSTDGRLKVGQRLVLPQ